MVATHAGSPRPAVPGALQTAPAVAPLPWGLYVHIPFCPYRCHFCDFVAVAAGPRAARWIPRYLAALPRELAAARPAWEGDAATAFYGGGTPTVLAPADLADLHGRLAALAGLPPGAETTLEANPGTVTRAGLRLLRAAGFNRISLGLQTWQDRVLAGLGRLHTAADFVRAFAAARDAGFEDINVDLIYGLPGQSATDWAETLDRVIALGPEHVSAYGLQVEAGSLLAAKPPPLPDDDEQADMYAAARRRLAEAGYLHYEISNWCRPGRACRHNLLYWRSARWLGLGIGAASCDGPRRFTNASRLAPYCEAVEAGRPAPRADVSLADPASDALILGLRLLGGIDPAAYASRCGDAMRTRFGPALLRHLRAGRLSWEGGTLHLTEAGLPLGNRVWVDLL